MQYGLKFLLKLELSNPKLLVKEISPNLETYYEF
jgi:hypothetical protein